MKILLRYACMGLLCLVVKTACAQMNLSSDAVIYSTEASAETPADSTTLFTIKDIIISGNRQTKPATILRELSFSIEEQYPLNEIVDKFAGARQQLMNTGLFRSVTVSLKSLRGYDVYVNIEVEERWYIYPILFLKPVDVSFLTWATQTTRDMQRLNYGVRLTHKNFTGRNDRLYLNFTGGFTKQIELQYHGLYLDPAMKWFTNIDLRYGKNRDVNYITSENKPRSLNSSADYVFSFFRTNAEITYRPAIKTRHTFGIGYSIDNYADTILKLNPAYSPTNKDLTYIDLYYNMAYTDVDFIPYPTKGYLAEIGVTKKGFNNPINLWQVTAKTSASWPTGKSNFLNVRAAGVLKLPFRQPYITQQFIGTDLYLQGYENYTIDGVAGGYVKASFAQQLFSKQFKIPSKKIAEKLNHKSAIPFRLYAKAFFNAGYVYNREPGNNTLSNKLLYTGGIGLDIVTLTDLVIKIEWSFNQLGQNGLYLHPRNNY